MEESVAVVAQITSPDHVVSVSTTILQVVATLSVVWVAGTVYAFREMNKLEKQDTQVDSFRGMLLYFTLLALWMSGLTMAGAVLQVAVTLRLYVGPHLALTLMEIGVLATGVVLLAGYASWGIIKELEQDGILATDELTKLGPLLAVAAGLYFVGGIATQLL